MLLGIPPDSPKTAYGWIEPGAPLGAPLPDTVRYVRSFWNKPAAAMASALMKNGFLLNSFLMVGQVDTFWALMQRAMPALTRAFEAIRRAFFTEREEAAVLDLYARIPSTSFSGNVLAKYPDRLAVVCADKLGWKHFAEPGRDLPVLGREESGLLGPEAA
jgi:mannose-1-phosphate guanylyltransferase